MKQQVEVVEEQESGAGWVFTVAVGDARHAIRLSWVDHDHWSGGACAPAHVVSEIVNFLLEHKHPIPDRFDAATIRRRYPSIEDELPGRLPC
ncbi:MAG: hypothetical protein AAFX05_00355 [Planctomycetota bacterium]